MARQNNALDYRVESAIIQVCEDLSVPIDEIAKDICDEFEGTDLEASYEAIVKELTEARAVQIEENKIADRLYVECVA